MGHVDFDSLYRDHVKLVQKIVRAHGFHDEALEDLVQTIFLKAWSAIHTLQSLATAKPWLSTIARNECRDEIRSRRRKERLGLSSAAPLDPSDPSSGAVERATVGFWSGRPEEELTQEEKILCGVVRALIEGRLETTRAQVAKRFYLNGETTTSIAHDTGMAVGTVCSHLSRFRAELKAQLETRAA